jgi:SAM-dependent methyltransferase
VTQADQRRWDQKWSRVQGARKRPHPLLEQRGGFLSGGYALDLACGLGQNAIWLAKRGYRVLGVDISTVALDAARTEARRQSVLERIDFHRVDLDVWRAPEANYDLICVFRFLDRRLFPSIRKGLRPGGFLYYSTRHKGFLQRNPSSCTAYLLARGELLEVFGDWHILHYREGPEEAELIASKNQVQT